jgi:hypothetical protein
MHGHDDLEDGPLWGGADVMAGLNLGQLPAVVRQERSRGSDRVGEAGRSASVGKGDLQAELRRPDRPTAP